jgi:hypothetical protein
MMARREAAREIEPPSKLKNVFLRFVEGVFKGVLEVTREHFAAQYPILDTVTNMLRYVLLVHTLTFRYFLPSLPGMIFAQPKLVAPKSRPAVTPARINNL